MARRKRKSSQDQLILQSREIRFCEICQRNYIVMASKMWRFVLSRYRVGELFLIW